MTGTDRTTSDNERGESVDRSTLSWGVIARLVLAASLLGPLVGVVLFFIASIVFEGSTVSQSLFFSPIIFLITAWFVPCGLLGGLLILLWRKKISTLGIFPVMICGALGGFVPAYSLFVFLDGVSASAVGALAGLIGAMTALLLWVSRGLIGLRAL